MNRLVNTNKNSNACLRSEIKLFWIAAFVRPTETSFQQLHERQTNVPTMMIMVIVTIVTVVLLLFVVFALYVVVSERAAIY